MNLLQRIKVLFTGIGAMLLLVIIAISPVLLSKWNDSRILAQVIVEKINEKDILSMHTSKLSTEEKIKLLYDYNSEIQNYVCIKQLIKSKEDYNKIRENIVQEIKELQNLQIIPIVDLDETYENNTFQHKYGQYLFQLYNVQTLHPLIILNNPLHKQLYLFYLMQPLISYPLF